MRLLTKLTHGRFGAKLDGMFSVNSSGKLGCSDVILVVCVIFFIFSSAAGILRGDVQ